MAKSRRGLYDNTPMYNIYVAIFHDCRNVDFQMNNYDNFLTLAQIIDHGHTLEVRVLKIYV